MLLISLSIIIGLALLVWSADRFISGAMGLAHYLDVSPLIIGIIVVGFGTSAPELFISAIAAIRDTTGLAVGNAIGSNITNIALILGITACLTPLVVRDSIFRREFPILLIATALTWLFIKDQLLTLVEGSVLILLMLLVLYVMSQFVPDSTEELESTTDSKSNEPSKSLTYHIFWLLFGLIVLLISSDMLVTASVELAQMFGVSDVIIGLTIIAIGTSLPELAASVTGALKHHTDLAIGNIIGSNIFNIAIAMTTAGLINSAFFDNTDLLRDFMILTFSTLIFYLLIKSKNKLKTVYSVVLVITYFLYIESLFN